MTTFDFMSSYWQISTFIDDVMIFERTFEEHITNLEMVFERMRNFGTIARLKKCEIACKELYYLGHRIGGKLDQQI